MESKKIKKEVQKFKVIKNNIPILILILNFDNRNDFVVYKSHHLEKFKWKFPGATEAKALNKLKQHHTRLHDCSK